MDGTKQNNIQELPPLTSYQLENLFNVYRNDTNYFYNLINTVNFPTDVASSLYTIYTVPNDNLPWTYISFKNYGTMDLWWLICSANNIQNPIVFPKAGTELKVLIPSVVSAILTSIKQS
jgi:hypothetical protein